MHSTRPSSSSGSKEIGERVISCKPTDITDGPAGPFPLHVRPPQGPRRPDEEPDAGRDAGDGELVDASDHRRGERQLEFVGGLHVHEQREEIVQGTEAEFRAEDAAPYRLEARAHAVRMVRDLRDAEAS